MLSQDRGLKFFQGRLLPRFEENTLIGPLAIEDEAEHASWNEMVGSHTALLGNAEMFVLWLEGQLYRCLETGRGTWLSPPWSLMNCGLELLGEADLCHSSHREEVL